MKFFSNKKFLFKIIVALCICVTIIHFGMMPKSNAASVSALGGQLLDPVVDLMLVIGDGFMELIQQNVIGSGTGLIFDNLKENWFDVLKGVVKGVLAIVAGLLLVGVLAWLATFIPVIGGMIAAGVSSGVVKLIAVGGMYVAFSSISAQFFPDNIFLPTFYIGPEEIFSGEILLFDANIFSPKEVYVKYQKSDGSDSSSDWTTNIMPLEEWNEINENGTYKNRPNGTEAKNYFYYRDGNKRNVNEDNIVITSINNSAYELKDTIAKWYYTIRNIALVALMSILVYVGIKMLLSSIAADKAKYKQMLSDWVIAMCLILLMQYIMVFANTFVENVVSILSNVTDNQSHAAIVQDAPEKLVEGLEDEGMGELVDGTTITWPTNLMGKVRVEAQKQDGTAGYVGYAICYLVLVMYTVFFTFTYLKRLLYILFLTVISPLVAMTYPLDKIRDGQAQAFNMWMKEYIYNLLIQPFHLLLYVIFVSMAFDLAGSNIIYSLVVIGFMMPAEKFLRRMFGFDKASTPGFLGGAAGAAMAISGVKSLANFAAGGKGSGKGKGSPDGNNKIKQAPNVDFLNRTADSGNNMTELLSDAAMEGTEETTNQESNNQSSSFDGPEELTDQQRMLDGYDDNYGTDEWDAAERDRIARGAYSNQDGQQYSDEDYIQILRDSGYSDDEIADLIDENSNIDEEVIEPDNSSEQNGSEQQYSTDESEPADNNDIKMKKLKGYLSAAGQNYLRNAQNNKYRFGSTLKRNFTDGIKTVAKTGLGATAAGIGVAAGIASGSPGDVLKYGASAAYAGASIGEGLANRGMNAASGTVKYVKNKNEEILKTQYGNSGYKQKQKDDLDKMFRKDAETRKLYAEKLDLKNKEQIDYAMEQAVEFRKYGVTDNNTIISALKQNSERKATKETIAAAKLATISKNQKDFDKSMEKYASMKGVTKDKADRMRKMVKDINSDYNLL